MKIGIFSVKDALVGFSTPFYARNDAEALRIFSNSANATSPNFVNTNPGDKSLCRLGYFDEQTGDVSADFAMLLTATAALIVKEDIENASTKDS